jgi:SAM-dependent methyltransferase
LRSWARRLVPGRWRAGARRAARDFPIRLRDLPDDLGSAFGGGEGVPLPPARLRFRVGASSSREEFLRIGRVCADDLMAAYLSAGRPAKDDGRWLDFGSGCGRVARHLIGRAPIADYTGVDVDAPQIAWAARHLAGRFATIPPSPPTALPSGGFDVVFSISVFTHLDEAAQFAWLAELRRLLRPGGLLLATTHAPKIAESAIGIRPEELAALARRGFLFRRSVGPFNEQAAFHSGEYLRSAWAPSFDFVAHHPFALGQFQDITLWQRREGASA